MFLAGALHTWTVSLLSKQPVSLFWILRKTVTKLNANQIVSVYILARHAGLAISLEEIEEWYKSDPISFPTQSAKKVKQLLIEQAEG